MVPTGSRSRANWSDLFGGIDVSRSFHDSRKSKGTEIIRTFTLDTNCIVAVANHEPAAAFIRALADAHANGQANVALVAISASERQRAGQIENFAQFRQRLTELNLGHLDILPAMFYLDICFWDNCLWSDDAMEQLERSIHDILFSNVEFEWAKFCETRSLPQNIQSIDANWRNAKCDVQALWAHVHHRRDVFVTSDRNFHSKIKKAALASLGSGEIMYPDVAASFI
jgi:hypothetical protein